KHRIVVGADVDRPEALLVALQVLLQRLEQALGVPRRRDHTRADLRAAVARLDEREVENELVLGVVEQHEVRVHPLRDVFIDLNLELGGGWLVRHGWHPIASRRRCLLVVGAETCPARKTRRRWAKPSLTSDEDRGRDRAWARLRRLRQRALGPRW